MAEVIAAFATPAADEVADEAAAIAGSTLLVALAAAALMGFGIWRRTKPVVAAAAAGEAEEAAALATDPAEDVAAATAGETEEVTASAAGWWDGS